MNYITLKVTCLLALAFATNSTKAQIWSLMNQGLDSTVYSLYENNGIVYAGGDFTNSVASFDGTSWTPIGTGANGSVRVVTFHNNQLVAGGLFDTISGVPASNIATWNGTTWDTLGTGFDGKVSGLFSDTATNLLYACGNFNNAGGVLTKKIAVWDGTTWSALSTGMDFQVFAVAVYNGVLYAGGDFDSAGGTAAFHFAKWDGSSWSAVGNGSNLNVNALKVFQGELYVAGKFTNIGGSGGKRIAKWDGTNWSAVGSGFNNEVFALGEFKNELYAAGAFTTNNIDTIGNIARYSDSTWKAVSVTTMDSTVLALTSSVTTLYTGGRFTNGDGIFLNHVAQTDVVLTILENHLNDTDVLLYPNPVKLGDNFTVVTASDLNQSVEIYNSVGKLVEKLSFHNEKQITIGTSNLISGIYFVKITSGGQQLVKKVMLLK